MHKQKGGKYGTKIVADIPSEMSREQLVEHVNSFEMELERKREEGNFPMLEHEKLFALWNIAVEQLHGQRIKSRLAVQQMKEYNEEKQMELVTHKQKLRLLLTEQSKKVDEGRIENLKRMSKTQDDMLGIQSSLKELVKEKSRELCEAQTGMQEIILQMKMENVKKVDQVKNETCLEMARLENNFIKLSLDRENREAIAFAALRDDIREMTVFEKKIMEELGQSKKGVQILEEYIRMENKERKECAMKDRKVNENTRKELRKIRQAQKSKDKYVKYMEFVNEALFQKVNVMEGECKAFKQTVTTAILDMQREADMKRMILEVKLNKADNQKSKTG